MRTPLGLETHTMPQAHFLMHRVARGAQPGFPQLPVVKVGLTQLEKQMASYLTFIVRAAIPSILTSMETIALSLHPQ